MGGKDRNTLPDILTFAGIVLDALQVYATHGSPSFPHHLMDAIEDVQVGKWPVEMFPDGRRSSRRRNDD